MAVTVRPAARADAFAIARMLDIASDGLASWFWSQIAEPGEDALAVGKRHSASDDSDHSWRRTIVAEFDGQVAGGLSTYRLPAAAEPAEEPNPMMRVVRHLESRVPGTQYVYQLATFPGFRRCGVARALLAEVERLGAGASGLSVVVVDSNAAARALYDAAGFAEVARAPIAKLDGWASPGEDLVLLLRPPQARRGFGRGA